MKSRSLRVLFAAAALAAATAAVAAAQGTAPAFVPALLEELGKNGWTVQERNAFAEAAAEVDWSQARAADAEAVALALCLQTRERLRLTVREQAEVALRLALMTREMRAAGFDEQETAVAAVHAYRSAFGDIERWVSGGRGAELGEILRARIAAAIKTRVQLAAGAQPAGGWSGDRQESGPGGSADPDAPGPGGPSGFGQGNGR